MSEQSRQEHQIEQARALVDSLGDPRPTDLLDMAAGLDAEVEANGVVGLSTGIAAAAMLRFAARATTTEG